MLIEELIKKLIKKRTKELIKKLIKKLINNGRPRTIKTIRLPTTDALVLQKLW